MEAVEGIRLSPQQRRLWLLAEAYGPLAASACLLLDGALDAAALRAATADLAGRHDILRTRFHAIPGLRMPVQVIAEDAAPAWSEEDLLALTPGLQQARIEALLAESPWTPTALAEGPTLRATLLALGADRHALVLRLPALCADSRTLHNLVSELAAAYESRIRRRGMEGEPMQYWQYSEWLNDLQEEEGAEEGCAYWDRIDLAAAAPLPGQLEPAEVTEGRRFRTGACRIEVGPDLLGAMRRATGGESAALPDLLLAAWQVLLSRLTGVDRVTIGVAVDGREFAELGGALGPFTRTLPWSGRLERETSFSTLVAEARSELAEIADRQRFFLREPARTARRDRPSPTDPGFAFDYLAASAPSAGGGVEISLAAERVDGDPFLLKLVGREQGGAPALTLVYDAERLRPEEAERFASYLSTLLAAAEHPGSPARELEILAGPERARVLAPAARPMSAEPAACAHQLFAARAARAPEAPAVVFGERRISYAALDSQANRLAHRLRALGVGAESRVALCLEPAPEVVVALLAVWKAGGAYVPLDPHGPVERRAFMLRDSGAAVLVTQPSLADGFSGFSGTLVFPDAAAASPDAGAAAAEPAGGAQPASLAYVIYTSGSTGTPKGVGVEHRHLARYLDFVDRELFGDRIRCCPLLTALTFDASLKQVVAPLLRGDTVWVVGGEAALDPAGLLRELGNREAAGLNCTPTLWRAILEEIERQDAAPMLSGLAGLFLGGEQLSQDLFARTAALLPQTRVWNLYGPTEATANAAAALLAAGRPVTLGSPLPYTRIYLVDGLTLVPPGAPGEIAIGGGGVARGYLGRPDLTAERFLPDPFAAEPGARLYRTGDLGRLTPAGEIEFLGRIDHQVKIRGFRIELGEIEARLQLHPAVREAVVLAEKDGHETGETRLVAYLVPEAGAGRLTSDALRSALSAMLPEYMVPTSFVTLQRLPLLPSGKVDRRGLFHSGSALAAERSFVAPRTRTERRIAEIWAAVLGREEVGVEDNFFELGGHSIQSIQISHRINEAGYAVSPRDLLHHPTVADLAALADAAGPGETWEEGNI